MDFDFREKPSIDDVLIHYGVGHKDGGHSGRYPWGSGEEPFQTSGEFISRVRELRDQNLVYIDPETGKTYHGDTAIAKSMKMSTTEFRVQCSLAVDEERTAKVARAQALYNENPSYTYVARKMGLKNESSARSLLDGVSKMRTEKAQKTADFLKERLEELNKDSEKPKMIDIGEGVGLELGISEGKLAEAAYILEREGYVVLGGRVQNQTDKTGDKQTTLKVLALPGTPKNAVYDYANISSVKEYEAENNGESYKKKFTYPASMDSKRLMIRYAEDGGITKDGTIELRPGVQDLSLGGSAYSQVRILVDDSLYLKGMAYYGKESNFPDGVDVIFNTNKTKDKPMEKVLKEIKNDPENPFGSTIKEESKGGQYWYIDKDTGEEKLGLINKKSDEGDWSEWANKVPAQFLSKQSPALAKRQLTAALKERQEEYEDILKITNPTLRKKLLEDFAGGCDSDAVTLKAAALPRQRYQVILPLDAISETEIYAPNFRDGEKVALVRYPHAGTFEIPILTVNNKIKEGKEVLGTNPSDGVCINSKTAAILSGADYDGDTVMVIPTHNSTGVKIKNRPPLEQLKDIDIEALYGSTSKIDSDGKEHFYNRNGDEFKPMKDAGMEMGKITNLITDMTFSGATDDEVSRAVIHSMVVIDAKKHHYDYRLSEKENRIDELKRKYQIKIDEDGNETYGGVATLISRSKSIATVDKREGSPKVNIEGTEWYDPTRPEGALIYKTARDSKLYYEVVKNPNWKKGDDKKFKEADVVERDGKKYYNQSTVKGEKDYVEITNEPIITKKRTQNSTKMAETDDAYSLVSTMRTEMEILYADYANGMKSLANSARKEAYNTEETKRDPVAAQTYAEEVQSLKDKVTEAKLNTPRERLAQTIAASRSNAMFKDNPGMTNEQKGKKRNQNLMAAREQVGAKRKSFSITDREWEAIQMGAISPNVLTTILRYTDQDKLKERATPRTNVTVTPTMVGRMEQMRAMGKTNSQIAAALGISTSTVVNNIGGKNA